MNTRNRTEWTDERIEILRNYYQVESNEKVAGRLGVSSRTLVRKAKELNIYKPKAVTKSTGLDDVVREMYSDHSLREIGEQTKTSWRTIERIAQRLGLSRTKEEDSLLRSRIRTKMLKSERARICFGLEQRTNIKLVTNKTRIRLRCKLKEDGYIVLRDDMTVYYPEGLKRHLTREENGRKLGLDFAPWCPTSTISNQTLLTA